MAPQPKAGPVDPSGVFIGYSADTAAAVVFRVCQQEKRSLSNDIIRREVCSY